MPGRCSATPSRAVSSRPRTNVWYGRTSYSATACDPPRMTRRRAGSARSSIFALLALVGPAAVGVGTSGGAVAAPPDPIPPNAWAPARSLPMDDTQHWPDLASVAEPLDGRPFFAEEICGFNPSPKRQFSSDQARARVDRGPGRWSLQQQIVHFPGQVASSSERAGALFSSVVDALAKCPAQGPRHRRRRHDAARALCAAALHTDRRDRARTRQGDRAPLSDRGGRKRLRSGGLRGRYARRAVGRTGRRRRTRRDHGTGLRGVGVLTRQIRQPSADPNP